MASIRRRGSVWQARVSRKGFPAEVGTFETKGAAERWARTIESEMDRGVHVSRHEAERTTIAEVIERYIEEVSPLHKGHETEVIRLRALQRSRLAEYTRVRLMGCAWTLWRGCVPAYARGGPRGESGAAA